MALKMGRIAVETEWAPLRRAVVGDGGNALADVLKQREVDVLKVPAGSIRDGLFAVGGRLIAGSLRANSRRAEAASLCGLVAPALTVPAGSDNEVDGPFLEGGDVILNGGEVYVGMSGNASNMEGIDWLTAALSGERKVVPMAMRSSVRHLEDVLALLRPGLLIQCRPLLVDGLPRALRDWQSIDIAPEERANVLVLDEGHVIVDRAQSRLADELARRGIEAISVGLGGGPRSAHCALLRE